MANKLGLVLTLPNIDYTNVDREIRKFHGVTPADPIWQTTVDETLYVLAEKVALKHPQYRLQALGFDRVRKGQEGNDSGLDGGIVSSFQLCDKYEVLGTFGVEPYYVRRNGYGKRMRYTITNDRINEKMARSDSRTTEDATKALAIINKMFSNLTPAEAYNKERKLVINHVDSFVRDVKNDLTRKQQNIPLAKLLRFALERADEFKKGLVGTEIPAFEDIPEARRKSREARVLHEAPHNLDIVIRGENYIIGKATGGIPATEITMRTADQLPEWLKGRLGILKLVADCTFVEDIGWRQSETAFRIIRSEDETLE